MPRRTTVFNFTALAAALLLFAQATLAQTVHTRRLPGGEEDLPPPRPGRPHLRLRSEPAGQVFALAFSPGGSVLAVSTINRVVNLWSTETGELLRSFVVPGGPVSSLRWSPDGRVLLAYNREAVKFWDARTGERIYRRGTDVVAVSPDRRFVAAAAAGATRAQVWEVAVAP